MRQTRSALTCLLVFLASCDLFGPGPESPDVVAPALANAGEFVALQVVNAHDGVTKLHTCGGVTLERRVGDSWAAAYLPRETACPPSTREIRGRGETYDFTQRLAPSTEAGEYRLVVRLRVDGDLRHVASNPFVVD